MKLYSLSILLISTTAYGSGGAVHVPTGLVISQFANLFLLLCIIFYFGKDAIRDFFSNMKSEYLESRNAAAASFEKAESEKNEIENRLNELRSSKKSDIESATNQAEDNRKAMIADGRNQAEQIQNEAQSSMSVEQSKAMDKLRLEIFSKSKKFAEENLKTGMGAQDQLSWNERMQARLKREVH